MSDKTPELFLVLASNEPRAGINIHVAGLMIGQGIDPKHAVGKIVPDIKVKAQNQFFIAALAQLAAKEVGLDPEDLEISFKTYRTKDSIEGVMVFLYRE